MNSHFSVCDGSFSHSFPAETLNKIKFKSVDADGFLLFEIYYSPVKANSSINTNTKVNTHVLFFERQAKGKAYGPEVSVYRYFKRNKDLDYFVLVERKGSKTKKVGLGSLDDPKSRLHQVASAIDQNFRMGTFFDRKKLSQHLLHKLTNCRILKGCLDILTAERFLTRKEEPYRGNVREVFMKTETMEGKFKFDPRLLHKPFGEQFAKAVLSSDRR